MSDEKQPAFPLEASNRGALWRKGRDVLRSIDGIENPALEARLLLQYILDTDESALLVSENERVDQKQCNDYAALIRERSKGRPVSKIIGRKAFWRDEFFVSENVLDPRPDSETLIEAAVAHYAALGTQPRHILDLGTGSGCLLLSLLREWPDAIGTGVDISPDALDIAQKNADNLELSDRVRFIESNWCEGLDRDHYDLIVSNPPYISESEIESLAKDVRFYDPILALSGGKDGLDAYEKIFYGIKKHLKAPAIIFLECGHEQAGKLERLAKDHRLRVIRHHRDIAGIPRVVEISFGEKSFFS